MLFFHLIFSSLGLNCGRQEERGVPVLSGKCRECASRCQQYTEFLNQEYFMDLYLLAELKTIALKITTVDMLKPPPDFRSNFDSTPPPILIDAGVAILENEKIERHIMKAIPGGHNLFVQVIP